MSQGKTTDEVCRIIGIGNQTYYLWRKEYWGLQISQVKKIKILDK
ncbi:MAG: transposase [Rickettsiaceae bacterium]